MPVEDLLRIEALDLHWPALRRGRWALWLNVLVPGAGLVALQQPMPGLLLTAVFLLSAETALFGLLLVPQAIDGVATTVAATAAGACWFVLQVLLMRRLRELHNPEYRLQAAARIEQAREAVLTGEWALARQLLEEAAQYDPEQPELNWLLAKVCTAVGRSDVAVRQWRRLRQVDHAGRYQADIEQALSARPGRVSAVPSSS